MSPPHALDSLDLAALVCSRVCHDVISPVGAIVNGLEMLEEVDDEQTKTFALDLVRKSARQASARLQFARLAFGAAGGAGAAIDLNDAGQVAKGIFSDDKMRLEWSAPHVLMAKNKVKLLLNLVLVAQTAIPRGGTIAVTVTSEGDATRFRLAAAGPQARVPNVLHLLAGEPGEGRVDAHAIQPFYTGLVARAAEMAVTITAEADAIVIAAEPVPA